MKKWLYYTILISLWIGFLVLLVIVISLFYRTNYLSEAQMAFLAAALVLMMFIGFFANAQWLKNIFEYSTPFFSYNETNPLTTLDTIII